jgi:hypothetical protein
MFSRWGAIFVLLIPTVSCMSSGGDSARDATLKRIAEHFSLAVPWNVMGIDLYLDGGSIGVSVQDAEEAAFYFWLEPPKPGEPRHFYVGDRNDPKARSIALCSPEDQSLIDILEVWALEQSPEKELRSRSSEYERLESENARVEYGRSLLPAESLALEVWWLLTKVRADRSTFECG